MEDKLKKILIVGSGNLGADFNSPVKLKDCHKHEVIVIGGEPTPKQVIEINGVKYEKIIHKPLSKNVSKAIIMASAYSSLTGDHKSDYVRERPQVDVVKEFELIQNKQSKLCRNDRDWVMNQFKRLYRQVD